jgi:ATP-binding protein involved in chromosome partitioning
VRNIIGIASGKGGVGKSTVSVNLAVALAQAGARVGLLDADIYGPNIPLMVGVLDQQPQVVLMQDAAGNDVEMLLPVEKHGIKIMSMGFLIGDDQPVIWRGPMLNSALRQFLAQVSWGDLDYLIVDLPPGTGDVQISLIQLVRVTGIVHVTTPQDVALQDVRKGLMMFKSQSIPLLGVIENMSYFVCPHCDERTDKGVPVILGHPDSIHAKKFHEVAEHLAAQVSIRNFEQSKQDVPAEQRPDSA